QPSGTVETSAAACIGAPLSGVVRPRHPDGTLPYHLCQAGGETQIGPSGAPPVEDGSRGADGWDGIGPRDPPFSVPFGGRTSSGGGPSSNPPQPQALHPPNPV